MNNLKNLYPCLESIRQQTTVSYEVLVTAYLFSKENLEKAKKDFPWVTFIESNEIRGFSENNNLALRKARGKYCFVLNDDTEMKTPVIDDLVSTIEKLPQKVAIISPVTIYPNGDVQMCGRPPVTWVNFILMHLHIITRKQKKYFNKEGIFKSYNILGAAFLIKTDIFREINWFDEYYFFCPEDIALSTLLNKKGYECWVNSDIKVIHYEGMSSRSLSLLRTATYAAGMKGSLVFHSGKNPFTYVILVVFLSIHNLSACIFHFIKSLFYKKPNTSYIFYKCDISALKAIYSRRTPKELFTKQYTKLKERGLL